MAIVQTINSVYQFEAAFREARCGDQFSWEGFKVLFDYLEECSESTGKPVELDVIALCCEYEESSIQEIIDSCGSNIDLLDWDGEPLQDEEEIKEKVEEYLNKNTSVCGETADGFVYACF